MMGTPPDLKRPLDDSERARLGAFLSRLSNPKAMDLETLDGFLCGVVVGPVAILPSEFLPVIWGGELSDEDAFASEVQFQEILSLILRLMNQVAAAFQDRGVYLPELEERSDGSRIGHRWAAGFMRAVDLRRPLWSGLIQDENESGAVLPIALLAGEVDPEWLSKSFSAVEQDEQLQYMLAGAVRIHQYFLARRGEFPQDVRPQRSAPVRREGPKVGRNEPCPCGSGRKFKQCCGASGAVH
jgi:uncharacterized protein